MSKMEICYRISFILLIGCMIFTPISFLCWNLALAFELMISGCFLMPIHMFFRVKMFDYNNFWTGMCWFSGIAGIVSGIAVIMFLLQLSQPWIS